MNQKVFDMLNARCRQGIELLAVAGSRAYGTSTENSDFDYRGFYSRTPKEILTGMPDKSVVFDDDGYDVTLYNIEKGIHLLSKSNPTLLETLFAENFEYISDVGKMLIDNRNVFLSKKAFETFGGAKNSCLHKLNKDTERSVKAKAQAQAIRLLEEGIEVLNDGTLTVKRPNASFLLEVRNGSMLTEKGYSSDMFWYMMDHLESEFSEAKQNSSLPDEVDKEKAMELLYEINLNNIRNNT